MRICSAGSLHTRGCALPSHNGSLFCDCACLCVVVVLCGKKKERKENEKKKVTEVLSEQEEYDKIVEEQKAKAELIKTKEEKKSRVGEAFEEVKDILKEFVSRFNTVALRNYFFIFDNKFSFVHKSN